MQRLDNVTLCQLLSGQLYRLNCFRPNDQEIYDGIGFRIEHDTCLFLMLVASLLCTIIQFICWTPADICTISKFAHWILFAQLSTHIHARIIVPLFHETVKKWSETYEGVCVGFLFPEPTIEAQKFPIQSTESVVTSKMTRLHCIRFDSERLCQSFCLFCGNCINTM